MRRWRLLALLGRGRLCEDGKGGRVSELKGVDMVRSDGRHTHIGGDMVMKLFWMLST
jgi:hypothetical protein